MLHCAAVVTTSTREVLTVRVLDHLFHGRSNRQSANRPEWLGRMNLARRRPAATGHLRDQCLPGAHGPEPDGRATAEAPRAACWLGSPVNDHRMPLRKPASCSKAQKGLASVNALQMAASQLPSPRIHTPTTTAATSRANRHHQDAPRQVRLLPFEKSYRNWQDAASNQADAHAVSYRARNTNPTRGASRMAATTGTIKRKTDKGFGFIAAADGTEYLLPSVRLRRSPVR